MKRIRNILALLLTVLPLTGVWGQIVLPTSGDWTATTISQDTEVTLTGDVTIKGQITINHPCTLTIKVAEDATDDITISNGLLSDDKIVMFKVGQSAITTEPADYSTSFAKLVMKGTEKARIIIDGGAGYNWKDENVLNFAPTTNFHDFAQPQKVLQCAIWSCGSLDLEYVTIQKMSRAKPNTSYYSGAAIEIGFSGGNHFTGPTTLNHCIIQDCYAPLGPAIQLRQQSPNCDPEKSRVRVENSTITRCVSGGASGGTNNQGGAIRTYGNASSNLYLVNCTFSYNHALRKNGYKPATNGYTFEGRANGAALFWNGWGSAKSGGTRCVVEGCLFEHNKSDDCGGAIKTQSSLIFRGKETIIQNNEAPIGAGMYVEGYVGTAPGTTSTLEYDLNESLIIRNNIGRSYSLKGVTTPATGAGIHFEFDKDESYGGGMDSKETLKSITVNINGATIENNHTINDDDTNPYGEGGGIYFYDNSREGCTITFNLNHGTLQNNKATTGGGIYLATGNIYSNLTTNKTLLISKNSATQDGGGIYISNGNFDIASGDIANNEAKNGNGGGVCMMNGSIKMDNGYIQNNSADNGNGGGIYLLDGTITLGGTGYVQNNRTNTGNGGGLYVENTTDTEATASFSGGNIKSNHAVWGGGVCVNGKILLSFGRVYVDENTATNGGGICLLNHAVMNFNGEGSIRNNKAQCADDAAQLTTAYQKAINDLYGIGGGVYLDSNTKLTFNIDNLANFGLYHNIADMGADDIFANGNGTTIMLPKIDEKGLLGLSGKPYWVEDYITADEEYDEGTQKGLQDDANYIAIRYRNLTKDDKVYTVETNTYTNYICLALGYTHLMATIIKKGLKKGESAIFYIYEGTKAEGSDTYNYSDTPYLSIVLTGTEESADATVKKTFALVKGRWKVEETLWSWGYTPQGVTEYECYIDNASREEDRTFTFTNTKKTDLEEREYDETIVPNKMGE